MSQNHLVDPTWFYDAIEEFAFDYEWFPNNGYTVDNMGRRVLSYGNETIRGSLQPAKSSQQFGLTGNTTSLDYEFYCRSQYRINFNDFIRYKNRYLKVNGVQDYDEWGVRKVYLTMVNLSDYRDFADYIKYLEGDKTV